ncbi:pantoate--beta-alanine ligase [Pseudosulfitobacter pseudonitzschiae]|uniref:pantoate--beta-alanine ligase n=1 Tax=Pseudosulfitobacter pseudonitzschiae TaxID=1402135 RepID=UPI001AF41FC9|nr:pantoate--beta-alanine ligase [Pseudosulfitobacter pseudonitzschiae]MBM1816162.1 pantoate--beta-alanine ligase [Pseudosulfitobacter pseudonitzschiae]MBM1833468.1 pantoate--beta-alanine ligase [Pseudosulfitobacter pseudonitzschiae]MBM1838335.1 pantoate--beta-alanine ligase [Pseudosulfitobacter pseudonitzschiae]MBM1842867.1 pantoate--beta-alanine ligase [Pseudosulfitobacter pseudonitzschiae]MBM1847733.1 pantoate--beta-alanine ligase [Pseudosulfitobacter pseudonitzschiae]
MQIIRTKAALRALTRNWRAAAQSIGVVPTMGALHPGHLSLVEAAKARTDRVIVTLFVNPRQFNNAEDLAKYPRTEEDDARKLAPLAVDVLYVPDPEEMYPDGFATTISVGGVSDGLCGGDRPGHFDGVATVVTKLLLQTDADFAFFGEKDYQQLKVVRRLVTDLDIPVEIVGCATYREVDGLAMSSRNLRLDDAARRRASDIHSALRTAADAIVAGTPASQALGAARTRLEQAGFGPVDYLEYRRDSDLAPLETPSAPGRLLVAAWLEGVRLIDNVPV